MTYSPTPYVKSILHHYSIQYLPFFTGVTKPYTKINYSDVHEQVNRGIEMSGNLLCSFCSKNYETNSDLEFHLSVCSKVVQKKTSSLVTVQNGGDVLERKNVVKAEKKNLLIGQALTCAICNKHFAEKRNLKRHIRVHTEEHKYMCEVCNKSFVVKNNWKSHLSSHAGGPPYMCNICNKSFAVKDLLEKHIIIHVNFC